MASESPRGEKRDACVDVVSVSSMSSSVDHVVESCASVCDIPRNAMHDATKKRAHQHIVTPQPFFSCDRQRFCCDSDTDYRVAHKVATQQGTMTVGQVASFKAPLSELMDSKFFEDSTGRSTLSEASLQGVGMCCVPCTTCRSCTTMVRERRRLAFSRSTMRSSIAPSLG